MALFFIFNVMAGLPWFIILVVSYIFAIYLFGLGVFLFIGYLFLWYSINWFILIPILSESSKAKYLALALLLSFVSGLFAFILPGDVLDDIIDIAVKVIQS